MSFKEDTDWRTPSASDGSGTCVEVRRKSGLIEVRDTKDHGSGPILRFSTDELRAFLTSAKSGEYDDLV